MVCLSRALLHPKAAALTAATAVSATVLLSACSHSPGELSEQMFDGTRAPLALDTDEHLYFDVTVPSDVQRATFETAGYAGNADLFILFCSDPPRCYRPTPDVHDHSSTLPGSNEAIDLEHPAPGLYVVLVRATQAFDAAAFTVRFTR